MKRSIAYILARLSEPSTLAGLSVLAIALGAPPEVVPIVAKAVGGVAAAGAVLLPEKGAE